MTAVMETLDEKKKNAGRIVKDTVRVECELVCVENHPRLQEM